MPLTIKDVKKDLIKWNILEEVYEAYEDNIPKEQQLWNCTVNDYLVQVWINCKMEIDKVSAKDLLPLIPEEQKWLKKMLIKMMLGRKIFDFSPIVQVLADCDKPSQDELDYLFLHSPIGHRNPVPPV